jgi:hypothetical protein
MKRNRRVASAVAATLIVLGALAGGSYAEQQLGRTKSYPEPQLSVQNPPAGFNPMKASNGDLRKYGFPIRPTDPTALQGWTQAMEHFKYLVTPIIFVDRNPSHVTPLQGGIFIPSSGTGATPSPIRH